MRYPWGGVNNGTVNPPQNIKNPIIESPIKDKIITLPQKPQPITSPGINNGGAVLKDKIIDEKVNTFDNFQRLQI